jgi:polyisoprenoid-binding protein YceI
MNTLDGALPKPGTFKLDAPQTVVEFKAQHKVVGAVRERFDRTNGTVIVGKDFADSSVEVSIDSASLSTQNAVRDADVKGPDFLDAAKCPAVIYRGKGIRRSGSGWVMDGTLTIRGVSKVVALEFTFNSAAPSRSGEPQRVAFRATAAVQRAAFGMTRELLDEIGQSSKAPDVWIEIDAEALRKPAAGPGTER